MKLYDKDATYYRLSDKIYRLKSDEKEFSVSISACQQKFKVMELRIDHENGFKAMAVSPVSGDGIVDKGEMYFAFAGTNLSEDKGADLGSDIQILVSNAAPIQIHYPIKSIKRYSNLKSKVIHYRYTGFDSEVQPVLSQFDEGAIWVKAVIDKYQPKHKYGTGHSLGGGGMTPVGVMFDFDQVRTFSAPNTYSLLPSKLQKDFDNTKYFGRFVNYSHNTDLIGTMEFKQPTIGKEFAISEGYSYIKTLKGHSLGTFKFDGDNLVIKMDYDVLYEIAKKASNEINFIEDALKIFDKYIETTKKKAKEIENKYGEKISNGNFEFISRNDIESYMHNLSKTGHYDFYSLLEFEDATDRLRKVRGLVLSFAENLRDKTREMQSSELDLSDRFGL